MTDLRIEIIAIMADVFVPKTLSGAFGARKVILSASKCGQVQP